MAKPFHEIRFTEILELEEFLARIANPFKRAMTADLLGGVPAIVERVRAGRAPDAPTPVLRISTSEVPDAEAGDGRLMVSAGLIDHCLSIQDEGPHATLNIDTSFWPMLVPMAMMTWFIAHEVFHIMRGHNRLLEIVGADDQTIKAIERDADLCAAADLYRTFQGVVGHALPDMDLRKLVIYCTFWGLRQLGSSPQLTHSGADERILHIVFKVIQLETDPTTPVDGERFGPAHLERTEQLIPTLVACEKSFRRLHPNEAAFDFLARCEEGADRATVQAWDRIRVKHSILTGQRDGILDLFKR